MINAAGQILSAIQSVPDTAMIVITISLTLSRRSLHESLLLFQFAAVENPRTN